MQHFQYNRQHSGAQCGKINRFCRVVSITARWAGRLAAAFASLSIIRNF